MSMMITGGYVHADHRMQAAEKRIREEQRTTRRRAFEEQIERSYEELERKVAAAEKRR